ncbi:MAG: hypothetical protein FWG46_05645, partial [Treponema sp.]|nr:hypothetical protein [Treponema sp.]
PVLPNDASPPDGAESGDGFNFRGSGYFGAGKIAQADGSRPDAVSNEAATAFFLIKVWDSVDTSSQAEENDQLYDALVVGMNVYLEDTIEPTVRLYDLNPYTETLAVNNNSTQGNLAATIRRALDPRGIGENILRGGLYNDTNNADVELMPSGHIEPKTYATGTAGPNPLYPWVKTGSGYIAYSANGFTPGDDPENAMRDGSSITRDMVSGRVILRGHAHDDQLIREIRISISADSAPDANLYDPALGGSLAILKLDTSGTAATNPNYYTLQPAPGVNANVYQEFHWRDGHTVEWSYVWDTEARPNPAGEPVGDVGIWVAAIDHLGDSGTGQSSAAVSTDNYVTEVFKTTLRADIVPYVTGFERQGKYATVRSRQGWYSFYEGEQDIALLGYNLAGSGNTLALQYGGNALADVFNLPIMSHNKNRVVFNVPEMQQTSSYTDDNSTHSGKIILKVNGTQEALNHGSNFDQSWNREDNAEGADLWINRPYAHIWRSRHQDGAHTTFFGSAISTLGGANGYGLSTPAMALEYASVANLGRLTGVWAVYGAANMYYVRGAGRTGTAIFSGVPIEPYMGTDVSFYNGAVANGAMVHNYEADGSPNFRVRHGANFGTNYTFVNSNGPTKRYTNNRVVRTGGQSHVTTYDAYTSSLRFGTRGGTTATYFIDGASISSNASYDSVIPDSNDAGLYSAIDYDSIGPLIAYYDVQNDSLRLALTLEFIAPVSGTAVAGGSGNSRPFVYAGHRLNVGDRVYANNTERRVTWVSGSQFKLATNATGTSNYNPTVSSGPYTIIRQGWSKNYVVPPGSPFHSGSGRDVSIKVDKDNGIHLAFRNTNKNAMMYAYAASRDVAFTVYTVDTVVKGGTWTNVSVDNDGNPWIVYGSSSIGSYDGARMAYRSDIVSGNDRWFDRNVAGENTAGNNSYGWEAVSLPSDYAVSDDRLSIEVWPPTDRANYRSGLIPSNQAIWDEGPGWDAVIGYASDRYRLAYFYKPEWKDY